MELVSPGLQQNQVQPWAATSALDAAIQSIDKGGMRGLALVAMAIAEFELKQKAINLARDYYNTNKQDYDYISAHHQPAMQQTAQEAFGPSNPYYNYDMYASIAPGMAVGAITDKQWFEARRRTAKYNVGHMRRLDYDMAVTRAHSMVSGWNMGRRYELTWVDEHNQRAFNRKVSIANVGIGYGNNVRTALGSAVQKLASSYDNLGDTVASIGNGIAEYGGYKEGRTYARSFYTKTGTQP